MEELSFKEVAEKYPDFPRTVMRKIDTSLRGVILTERALERAKEEGAFYSSISQNGEEPNHDASLAGQAADFGSPRPCTQERGSPPLPVIGGVFFRDGTWVLGIEPYLSELPVDSKRNNPYILDVIDGKIWLLDNEPRPFWNDLKKGRGEPVEEVYFAPIPAYFSKKTSRGTPMIKVISSKVPNRISINIFADCQFFREKLPCKYCSYAANGSFFRRKDEKSRAPYNSLRGLREESHTPESLEDIYETVSEVLEEKGKWTNINLISGSDPRGNYENEVSEYIKVLGTLQRCFGTGKIPAVNRPGRSGNGSLPVNAIASAFSREQLRRLADAGLTAYISNIEVWDEKLFQWVCPGKAKYFGRQYWIDSILSAVEIFGRGNVSTQLVAGAELAEPYGFRNTDEALASNLEGVEFFARNGVYTTFCILWVDRGSVFYREKQKLPPLEYYVRLAKGINEIRRKYKLSASYSGYRGDGFHLDMDLARIDYNNV